MTHHSDQPHHEYLSPTPALDSDSAVIMKFVSDAVGGATDPMEQAQLLFYAVRDQIIYDP